jgi:hypothetical protein
VGTAKRAQISMIRGGVRCRPTGSGHYARTGGHWVTVGKTCILDGVVFLRLE